MTRGVRPAPSFTDPQGFGLSVLTRKELAKQGVYISQWRFRYGTLFREDPFEPHKEQDGRFASADGEVNGWSPGDHRLRGCLCFLDPVFARQSSPTDVEGF